MVAEPPFFVRVTGAAAAPGTACNAQDAIPRRAGKNVPPIAVSRCCQAAIGYRIAIAVV